MWTTSITKTLIFIGTLLTLQSCFTSYRYSYEEENAPLFKGDYRQEIGEEDFNSKSKIRVVSFNIEFAQHIDEAIELLKLAPLNVTDVLLLQEMDEKGTEKIAKALNMCYAYYPAIFHPKHGKNVGNAILTKWNIINSQKVKLPHPSSYPVPWKGKNYIFRKTLTIANIDIRGESIAFASTHAAAFNTTQNRKEFAQAITSQLKDIDIKYAVVGGDFNSLGNADIAATVQPFTSSDFLWASKDIGMTISEKKPILNMVPTNAFQLDHLFVKGMHVTSAGKVKQKGVSDHLPIWVELEF
ncbi:MAG: endonuclease/exonuclease/phosphatase family protein [Bacteroidota bacterium]